jgi:hypothetical protein
MRQSEIDKLRAEASDAKNADAGNYWAARAYLLLDEIDRLRAALAAEVVTFGFRGEYMEPIRVCRLCQESWPTKESPHHNPGCILA